MPQLKEELREVFEGSKNWAMGTWSLVDWLLEAQESFSKSFQTIKRWFGEISNYFETRTTLLSGRRN